MNSEARSNDLGKHYSTPVLAKVAISSECTFSTGALAPVPDTIHILATIHEDLALFNTHHVKDLCCSQLAPPRPKAVGPENLGLDTYT